MTIDRSIDARISARTEDRPTGASSMVGLGLGLGLGYCYALLGGAVGGAFLVGPVNQQAAAPPPLLGLI